MSKLPGAALVLVACLGGVLIFTNLGGRLLWDDEAETALLAQRVLSSGLPIAWDGRDLVSQECSTDFDANYLWRQTPWLPIYVMALAFKLFGVGTLAARLPFASVGLLSILSAWVLARELFGDRRLALVSAALLVLAVPFLLHIRQGRYYALAIFATIWVLYFFFALLRDRRGALQRYLGQVIDRMIALRVRGIREYDACYSLNILEMRLPGLVDDIRDGNEIGQCRKHRFVYRYGSLRAAEYQDGRNILIKSEILLCSFRLQSHERLADGYARARYPALHSFWEIRCGALERNGDPRREFCREQVRSAGFRIRLVDNDGNAEDARGEHRRHATVATLAHHDVRIQAEKRDDRRHGSRKRDEKIGDIEQ